MLFIHKTVSLCDKCYAHIPGNVVEQDDQIKLIKRCPEHGEMTSIVEIDKQFYYSLKHEDEVEQYDMTLFEASDKCQLKCPHCYHLPDNRVQDRPLKEVVDQVRSFPKNTRPMMAGAEATLRSDFIELCQEIRNTGIPAFDVLTNGVRFADKQFAQDAWNAGLQHACIGLNHWSYQGKKVHEKQLQAIQNLKEIGYWIGYIGYTIETLDHLPDILTEIETLKDNRVWQFRIRCGSFIGRSSDQERSYLSKLVKAVQSYYDQPLEFIGPDDNPYHVMVRNSKGAILRLIQWPDVTNIDMEELNTGPWCNFYDGPSTNFVHQVITRDAYKNMGITPKDIVPKRYQYKSSMDLRSLNNHWKKNWTGPVEVQELDWTYIDEPGKRNRIDIRPE